MAGRKRIGEVDPFLTGGFFKEPADKHAQRTLKRAEEQRAASAETWAIAYRLEQYANAGVLTERIEAHERRDWLWKIRNRFKGDVLAGCPDKNLVRGPIDEPFVGDEWLHKNWIRGQKSDQSLCEMLDKLDLPAL